MCRSQTRGATPPPRRLPLYSGLREHMPQEYLKPVHARVRAHAGEWVAANDLWCAKTDHGGGDALPSSSSAAALERFFLLGSRPARSPVPFSVCQRDQSLKGVSGDVIILEVSRCYPRQPHCTLLAIHVCPMYRKRPIAILDLSARLVQKHFPKANSPSPNRHTGCLASWQVVVPLLRRANLAFTSRVVMPMWDLFDGTVNL